MTASKKSSFLVFLDQLWIMLKRNTLLQSRNLSSTLTQAIIVPFLLSLILFILQMADVSIAKVLPPNPRKPLSGVSQCSNDYGSNCVSILYAVPPGPSRNVNYSSFLETFATLNAKRTGYKLKIENVQLNANAAPSGSLDIVQVPSEDFLKQYVIDHPNTVAWGVLFNQSASSSPERLNIQYQVWYNVTTSAKGTVDFVGEDVVAFVRGMDEAIISVLNDPSATVTANLDVGVRKWPHVAAIKVSGAIVTSLGPVFFFCSCMAIFISTLNNVVVEKEQKLRQSLELSGLSPAVYWISQILSTTLLVIINSLSITGWGYAFDFHVFKQTAFSVLFISFFLFGFGMMMFAFFISTVVHTSRAASIVGITIFIIGIIFEAMCFSSPYIGYVFWTVPDKKLLGRIFLNLPFFNFGKVFLDISTFNSNTIPGQATTENKFFEFSDIFAAPKFLLSGDVPAPIQSWYFLIMNCFVFGVLVWYLDNVVPDAYGQCKPLYFFLTPSFWGIELGFSKTTNLQEWHKAAMKDSLSESGVVPEDEDVAYERSVAEDASYWPALKTLNLTKVYKKLFNKKKTIAVENSSFTVKQGELYALLGQNGAGKTTTISMLSGLTPSTHGDAVIFGYSVRHQMHKIRQIMGICPQHDILYDNLTAREHIVLYAGIKGIAKAEIDGLVERLLSAVRLSKVADVRAGTFSGGMKRRLSVVISTIGDPKIVFMDECTTGMDPVNRRHVWSFIEEFKKDRVIIMTTHSMEEAEILGDRIGIMAKGHFCASGNPISLKNKFGVGYRISIITEEKNVDTVKDAMQQMIPGATIDDESAGALIYQFPASETENVPKCLEWLRQNKSNGVVKSMGIGQSTLEEVFLKLIRDEKPKTE